VLVRACRAEQVHRLLRSEYGAGVKAGVGRDWPSNKAKRRRLPAVAAIRAPGHAEAMTVLLISDG
jgi:hypothetical protein